MGAEMEGKKHLFLTGRKQVGKSTILRKLLENYEGVPAGFRTLRIPNEEGCSVHMFAPGETEFTDANRVFYRHKGVLYLDIADFDRIGCNLLAKSKGVPLILMDELGPTEVNAQKFRRAVWETLNEAVHVYGVLQMAESDFLDQVASRDDVLVINVTEENRDELPSLLVQQGW